MTAITCGANLIPGVKLITTRPKVILHHIEDNGAIYMYVKQNLVNKQNKRITSVCPE